MFVLPIAASTLPCGVLESPPGMGAITTTMLSDTMPRKKMSRYFLTASLFFRNKANMIAPAIWPKPFHYRRDAPIAARPGFSRASGDREIGPPSHFEFGILNARSRPSEIGNVADSSSCYWSLLSNDRFRVLRCYSAPIYRVIFAFLAYTGD